MIVWRQAQTVAEDDLKVERPTKWDTMTEIST